MKGLLIFLAVLSTLSLLSFVGVRTYNDIIFDRECKGFMKRAADANSVELAKKEMKKVIEYLETNNLRSGYTSIIYQTPDEDIGFWYMNMKTSYEELVNMSPQSTPVDKSNALIKLRETLTDQGEKGTKITHPKGISIYPYNTTYAVWGWMSLLFCTIFWAAAVIALDD